MRFPAARPRGRTYGRLAALALLAITASACAEDKPLNTFEPRGPAARNIDSLMAPIWWVMAVIFVLVVFGTIIVALRNRVKPDDYDPEDLPTQTHGNTPLELAWTIAPAILLAVVAIPTVNSIWDLEERNDDCAVGEVGPDCDGLDVMVIGQQWWWEYRYDVDGDGFFVDVDGDGVAGDADDQEWPLNLSLDPDDIVTATELVIPAGEQVDLLLTSRDVIHSFWIPRLNGKRDTVPGRLHTWSLEADEAGKYTGWCTEFCGLSHARMRMSVIALEEDDYNAWWENQSRPAQIPSDPEAIAGRELFLNNCQRCHVIDDGEIPAPEEVALVSGAAPNLTHFATRSTFAGAIYGQSTPVAPARRPNRTTMPCRPRTTSTWRSWPPSPTAPRTIDSIPPN